MKQFIVFVQIELYHKMITHIVTKQVIFLNSHNLQSLQLLQMHVTPLNGKRGKNSQTCGGHGCTVEM